MKKYILLIMLLCTLNITNVNAESERGTRGCIYRENIEHNTSSKTWKNYLAIDYLGLGTGMPTLGNIEYYSVYDDESEETIFAYTDDAMSHYINWNSFIPGIPTEYRYTTYSIIMQNMDDVATNEDKSLICPSKIYILEYEKETGIFNKQQETVYDLYACGNNGGDYNNDTCQVTYDLLKEKRQIANYDGTAGTLYTLEYYTGTSTNTGGQNDNNTNNVKEEIYKVLDQIEMYCDGTPENEENCAKAEAEYRQLTGQAEEQGINEEEIMKGYENYKLNQDYTYDESDPCYSLLGNPEDNINKPPAYYMNFVFDLLKYAAIVLLFVLTIVEFFKAIPSNDQDAIKKAVQKTIKRLILAVIIFFLPDLINFVLELLGIVSDPTCGIGG